MEVTTFEPVDHEGHPIYVRRLRDHWEYFTIIKNQLYTAHMTVRPRLWDRVLCFIGFQKMPYSKDEVNKIVKMLQETAIVTIESRHGQAVLR